MEFDESRLERVLYLPETMIPEVSGTEPEIFRWEPGLNART